MQFNYNSNFNATNIIKEIYESKDSDISANGRENLRELGHLSEKLYTDLRKDQINKEEIITDICSVASQWRSVIRENNQELKSDRERLKLYYAFENILDNVKYIVSKKMAEEKSLSVSEEKSGPELEGWGGFLVRNMRNLAASTLVLSEGIFNRNESTTDNTQNDRQQIDGIQNQFYNYSSSIFSGKPRSEVTYEDILEGIHNWETFTKQSFNENETDLRVAELKKKVMQEIDRPSVSQKTTFHQRDEKKVNEIRKFVEAAQELHTDFDQISRAKEEEKSIEYFQEFWSNIFAEDDQEGVNTTLFSHEKELQKIYDYAIAHHYRFYSFGDAMLIL